MLYLDVALLCGPHPDFITAVYQFGVHDYVFISDLNQRIHFQSFLVAFAGRLFGEKSQRNPHLGLNLHERMYCLGLEFSERIFRSLDPKT